MEGDLDGKDLVIQVGHSFHSTDQQAMLPKISAEDGACANAGNQIHTCASSKQTWIDAQMYLIYDSAWCAFFKSHCGQLLPVIKGYLILLLPKQASRSMWLSQNRKQPPGSNLLPSATCT